MGPRFGFLYEVLLLCPRRTSPLACLALVPDLISRALTPTHRQSAAPFSFRCFTTRTTERGSKRLEEAIKRPQQRP